MNKILILYEKNNLLKLVLLRFWSPSYIFLSCPFFFTLLITFFLDYTWKTSKTNCKKLKIKIKNSKSPLKGLTCDAMDLLKSTLRIVSWQEFSCIALVKDIIPSLIFRSESSFYEAMLNFTEIDKILENIGEQR